MLVRTDERKIAFQVKRRQTEKNESVRPVREFIGAMANSKFNEGIYVTTAPHFTKYAQKEFRSAEYNLLNKKMRISLIDGSRLKNLLEFHQPDERFISIFRKIAKEYDWNNTSLSCRNYHISEVFSETESSSFSK